MKLGGRAFAYQERSPGLNVSYRRKKVNNKHSEPGMVANARNYNTQEAEAGKCGARVSKINKLLNKQTNIMAITIL